MNTTNHSPGLADRSPRPTRIIVHGFGAYTAFFLHLIEELDGRGSGLEWSILLTTDHYQDVAVARLGAARVQVLGAGLGTALPVLPTTYPGHLFRDIEAEKVTFKFDPAERQCGRALRMYATAREFFARQRPDVALVSQVEGLDGKIFIAVAREFGVPVVVPTSCRNLGGIFFAPDDLESLPAHASASESGARAKAEQFLTAFRAAHRPAASLVTDLLDGPPLSDFSASLPRRILAALRRWVDGSQQFEFWLLRISLMNRLPWLRDAVWWLRARWNRRLHDARTLDDLPARFIFYPLQYTPESSINTPAPYFIDQLRAVDAIRFAMPSDMRLVVKEHPACIKTRSAALVRELRRRAGVCVAYYGLPGAELAARAGLTISVTGTATFEALLQGRSAIALGRNLVSDAIGGPCPLDQLPQQIAERFDQRVPDAQVLDALTRLYSVRYEANFVSPGYPGEPMLRRRNVTAFATALLDHLGRIGVPVTTGETNARAD